jgi:hypothetical protein
MSIQALRRSSERSCCSAFCSPSSELGRQEDQDRADLLLVLEIAQHLDDPLGLAKHRVDEVVDPAVEEGRYAYSLPARLKRNRHSRPSESDRYSRLDSTD